MRMRKATRVYRERIDPLFTGQHQMHYQNLVYQKAIPIREFDRRGFGFSFTIYFIVGYLFLSRKALGFAIVKYPDINCLLCISNIHP
jgi:hypothetical protein